jgi:integrase
MMQQAQPKTAATRDDAAAVRSLADLFSGVTTMLSTSLRRGAGVETVKELLGHASVATTIDAYGHLTVEDARAVLAAAGWFTGREVRL